MLATGLGFLTAVAAAWWGVRWYREQRAPLGMAAPSAARLVPVPAPPPSAVELPMVLLPPQPSPPVSMPEGEADPLPPPLIPEQPPETEAPSPAEGTPPVLESAAPAAPAEPLSEVPAPADLPPAPAVTEQAADAPDPRMQQDNILGYCARCRAKRYLTNPIFTRTNKGKPAIRGVCTICGANMLVFTTAEALRRDEERSEQ